MRSSPRTRWHCERCGTDEAGGLRGRVHAALCGPATDGFSAATCVASDWPFRELSEVGFCRSEQLFVLRIPDIGISPSRDVAEQLTETPIGIALAEFINPL